MKKASRKVVRAKQQKIAELQSLASLAPFLPQPQKIGIRPADDRQTAREMMEKAKALAAQGKSQDEIARELGMEPDSAPFQVRTGRKQRRDSTSRDPTPKDAPQERSIVVNLSEVTPSPVHWLWPGRIPLGKLTVMDGDPRLGKSLISLDLAARVTTARPMPDGSLSDLTGPGGVLILSSEDQPEDTIVPRLILAGADLARVGFFRAIGMPDGSERMVSIADINRLREALQGQHARLLIIDPLMAFLPSTVNSFRDQDIRSVLGPLIALAAELGVALLVIRHLNKTFMTNALYRGGDSIGIIGTARRGLLVALDPDDPTKKRRILVATKANLAALPSSMAYYTEKTPDGARSALEDARSFLVDALADGPIPANVLFREAGQTGIAVRTLHRAKGQMGVKTRKTGHPGREVKLLKVVNEKTRFLSEEED